MHISPKLFEMLSKVLNNWLVCVDSFVHDLLYLFKITQRCLTWSSWFMTACHWAWLFHFVHHICEAWTYSSESFLLVLYCVAVVIEVHCLDSLRGLLYATFRCNVLDEAATSWSCVILLCWEDRHHSLFHSVDAAWPATSDWKPIRLTGLVLIRLCLPKWTQWILVLLVKLL